MGKKTDRAFKAIAERESAAIRKRAGTNAEAENKGAMAAVRAAYGDAGPTPKLAGIKALMAAGDNRGAILAAAKLPDLGAERDAILRAKDAITNPDFQRQLRRDPAALIAAGVAALHARFQQ